MTRNDLGQTMSSCCLPAVGGMEFEDSIAGNKDQIIGTQQDNFAQLPGGWFKMGSDDGPHPEDGEGPVRDVFVDPFYICRTAVTNDEFSCFVADTGYETVAEQQGWSFVFHLLAVRDGNCMGTVAQAPWWQKIEGANWKNPFGPRSSIFPAKKDHPVVHIALPDALHYCKWAGCRLPTEAQWEFASRGGLDGKDFPWGEDSEPGKMANVWEGKFPDQPDAGNDFTGTCPVHANPQNGYGLHNMVGNVWEWTANHFTNLHSPKPVKNPKGPLNGRSYVAKGGSYLCHASYCYRYRNASRQSLDPLTTTGNVGFRVASRG